MPTPTLKETIAKHIGQFRALLAKFDVAPMAAKLADGTEVMISPSLAEGSEITKIGDDGKPAPLAPGDYTLEDGTVVTVAEGGKIATIGEADMGMADMLPKINEGLAAILKKNEEQFTTLASENKTLKEQLAALEQARTADIAAAKIEKEKTEKFNKELFVLVKKIADEPAGPPAKKTQKFDKTDAPQSRVDALVELHMQSLESKK